MISIKYLIVACGQTHLFELQPNLQCRRLVNQEARTIDEWPHSSHQLHQLSVAAPLPRLLLFFFLHLLLCTHPRNFSNTLLSLKISY